MASQSAAWPIGRLTDFVVHVQLSVHALDSKGSIVKRRATVAKDAIGKFPARVGRVTARDSVVAPFRPGFRCRPCPLLAPAVTDANAAVSSAPSSCNDTGSQRFEATL